MRNIILTGFMGTGKSSVGVRLARELGFDFVDTDEIIVKRLGLDVDGIFTAYGEDFFRRAEREAIRDASLSAGRVIATGGGAIINEENFRNLKRNGLIICLTASVDEIVKRLGRGKGRPLLYGKEAKEEVIRELLDRRIPFYRKADAVIDTTERDINEVVGEIKGILVSLPGNLEGERLVVELGERSYPIVIKRGLLNEIGLEMAELGFGGKVAVVTNPVVANLHGKDLVSALKGSGFRPFVIEVPDGEEYKAIGALSKIYDNLVEMRMERGSPIIAFGGGVIGDMGGFAAATYLRGVPYIQVPSTLLAQVDSSVGGKTGINHPMGKNLIGAFYQPRAVFVDINLLKTLDIRDIRAGVAEIIKYGIIWDEFLFSYLEKNYRQILRLGDEILYAIRRSCEIKSEIIARDEREQDLRSILNFGHTFGHAIESVTGYKRYRHGEAVAMGMVLSGEISCRLGLCDEGVVERIKRILSLFELPLELPEMPLKDILRAVEFDKKAVNQKIRFVMVEKIGSVLIRRLGREELAEALSP